MFPAYADKWMSAKKGTVDEKNTRGKYKCLIDKHIKPALDKQVAAVRSLDLRELLADCADLSDSTRSTIIYILKAIFGQAIEDEIIGKNPAASLKRSVDKSVPAHRALTQAEKEAVEKEIATHNDDAALLLASLYYTGRRFGEAMGPQWKHYDFTEKKVRVLQQLKQGVAENGGGIISKKLKTKNSHRSIPFADEFVEFLAPLRGLPGAYVFQVNGHPMKYSEGRKLWDGIMWRVPLLRGLTPHDFRHNFATELYKAGMPVKEAAQIMGETVKIMLETYVHIEKELGIKDEQRVYELFKNRVAE
jgi:integrase